MKNLLLLLMLLPAAAFAAALPAAPYVQVSGRGTLRVVPDIAHVSVTVEKTDRSLAAARAAVEHRAAAIIEAARRLGVAEHDIRAASLSIWPEYQWQNNTQVFVGQHVSRGIEITLRDLARYPDLVAALVKAGVDSATSARLDHSDMPRLRREALVKAVEDAHARAAALVKAAGAALGPVYSISESGPSPVPRPLVTMAARAASAAPPVYESGTIEVDAEVHVVYLLKQQP